jgi:hypothetical protein
MISTVTGIQLIKQRQKWNFASYTPEYEEALSLIQTSKWSNCILSDVVEFFKYGASIYSRRA